MSHVPLLVPQRRNNCLKRLSSLQKFIMMVETYRIVFNNQPKTNDRIATYNAVKVNHQELEISIVLVLTRNA